MANGYVSQVQLPNNETYDIKDKNAVKDITSSDISGNVSFVKGEETKDILVKDFGTAYGIDCYKGKLPLDFTSPGGAIDEWKIYGNSSGPTEVIETQSTLPVGIDTYGGNVVDWEIYGNNNPVIETESNTLPIDISSSGGNAVDWTIYGNDDNGTENLFDFATYKSKLQLNPIAVMRGTASFGDNSITITASSDDAYTQSYSPINQYVYTVTVEPNTQYTLSWKTDDATKSGKVFIFWYEGESNTYTSGTSIQQGDENLTITTTSTTNKLSLRLGVQSAGESLTYSDIMLVKGSTAPDHYIPYQQGVGERTAQLFTDTVGEQVITAAAGTVLSTSINNPMTLAAGRYTIHYYQSTSMTSNTRNTLSVFTVATGVQTYESGATNHNLDAGWYSWTFDIPNDGSYQMRIWIHSPSDEVKATNFILTKGETATPTEYIPYGYQIPISVQGKNLFDISTMIDPDSTGKYLKNDGTTGNEAGFVYTTYIPIAAQRVRLDNVAGGAASICCYDANKNFIRGQMYYQQSVILLNTSDAAFVRFSLKPASESNAALVGFNDYTFYIGDSPLTEGESVSKSSTGVDIELFSGDNIIDTSLYNKPNTSITYNSSVLGVGENTEITEELPIDFRSNGDDLLGYRIYGTANGSGTQMENLFDGTYCDGFITASGQYINGANTSTAFIKVEANTQYSIKTFDASNRFYIALYDHLPDLNEKGVLLTYSTTNTEHSYTLTTSADTAYVGVYVSNQNYEPRMVCIKGSTPPETYIPYGYKLPFTITNGTESKDTDIFIGNSKLLSGDYVDYEAGKIYKAKRIHEDTVTIDGIVWDILDYDHDEVYKADGTRAKHTVTIQTHDIVNELQYSTKQAVFAFPNGLAAGIYHFTVGAQPWFTGDVGKVLTFTLANAIPIGGQLVFNGAYNQTLVGTTVSVFASPITTTAAEIVTMTEGSTGTDLGTILRSKTDTINSIDRAFLGNNNWLESASRQYLNSDKTAGNVWTPQTIFDRPPIWEATTAGFLNGKSTNFISHIGTAKKTTGLNTISDGGGTAVHDEKIFLLSHSEVYMGDEMTGGEGTPYAYYKDYSDFQRPSTAADNNRIKYLTGAVHNWGVRTPAINSANFIRLVNSSGAMNGNYAINTRGIAPACCIVLDDMDDWVKQIFYTEVDTDLPEVSTFKGENTLDSTETLGETMITQGYRIPLQIEQGATTKTVDFYIGSTPLTEGQSISKTSTGTEIALYQGENTISTTLGNKPEMKIDYLSTVVGVGERTGNLAPFIYEWGNGYVSKSGTISSASEDTQERYSPHIVVEPNATYQWSYQTGSFPKSSIKNAWTGIGWYNDDGFISRVSGEVNIALEIVAPANAKYAILSFRSFGENYNTVFIKSSTPPSTYIPYGYQIPISIKQDDEIVDHKDIYIGTQPLIEGDYINQTGVYRRLHQFINYANSSSLPNYNFIPITEQLIAGNGENTITTSLVNNTTIDVELHPTKQASWICDKLENLQRRIDNVDSTLGAPERRNYLVTWCSEDRLTGSTANLDFSFNNKDNGYSTFLIDGKSTATSAFIETIDLLQMINGIAQAGAYNYTVARPGKYVVVIFGVEMEDSSSNTITLKIIRDNVVIASQQLINEYVGCIPFEIPNDLYGNSTIIQIEVNSTTGWTDLSFGVGIAVLNATMLLQDGILKTDTIAIGNFSMYDSYIQLLRSHRDLEGKCTTLENKCTTLENEYDQLANESVKDITIYSDYTSTIPSGLNIDISQYKNKIKYVDIYFTDNNYRKGEVYPYNILAENFGYLRVPYGQIYTGASADEATRLSLSLIGDENTYYIRRELFYVSTDYEQEHLFFSHYSSVPGLIFQFVGTPTNDWSDFSVKGKASEVIKIYEVHLIVSP